MEKSYEFNKDLHLLMVDFRQAFDSIKRQMIETAVRDMGIPHKLTKLVKLTLQDTKCKVAVQNKLTNEFEVKRGVRQGDALSTTIFNLMLHYAIGTLDRGGHIFIRSSIICAYADDIAIMATTFYELKRIFLMLEKEAAKVGLKINESKTKYIRMTRAVTETTTQYITINNYNFESVNSFTYLGALIHNKNDMHLTINDRIQAAQKCFYAYNKLFKSRLLNRSIKLRMYKTLIQPTLTYSCETWTLTAGDEEKLKIFERKLLRKIFGPKINEEGEYEIRSNQELDDLIQGQNIVKKIKAQRLRWAGHAMRMSEDRKQKRIMEATTYNTRARGRPRYRWIDGVENDCRSLGINRWRQVALDRSIWRNIVNKGKAHNGL